MMMNNQMMGMLQQLKANPMQFLMQRRMNLPQNISMNDPAITHEEVVAASKYVNASKFIYPLLMATQQMNILIGISVPSDTLC